MENPGVKCDVCECSHNVGCNQCELDKIQVTSHSGCCSEVPVPHFCGSYEKK